VSSCGAIAHRMLLQSLSLSDATCSRCFEHHP
jgi:hypothetical protein